MYKSNVVMNWRNSSRGYAIIGSRCKNCEGLFFPRKLKCQKCGSAELEDYKFKGMGKLFSFSIIHYAPQIFEKQVPYAVGIIELDEGVKITSQIVDFENLQVGARMEYCVRKIYADGDAGIIHYGIKFRPSDL